MGKANEQFEGQLPDEEVLLMFRKHPVVMRKGLIIASAGLLVGPLLTTLLTTEFGMNLFNMDEIPSMNFFFGALLASLVLSAILFFPSWMSWYFSTYLLTTTRFVQIKYKGFFNKNVVDIGLDNISMINYQVKGIQETLLGFGTIDIQTYVGELVIHEVHHPAKLQAELTSTLKKMGYLKQSQSPYLGNTEQNE
jgi:hypothetical protein